MSTHRRPEPAKHLMVIARRHISVGIGIGEAYNVCGSAWAIWILQGMLRSE